MMFEQICAFFVVFVTTGSCQLLYNNIGQTQKVNVSIFYESLCPDSIDFITRKFYPVYGNIRPYVDVRFIAFGKARVISEKDYRCQHGPRECLRNRLQACVLTKLSDQDDQIQFVTCAMSSPALDDYEQCAGLVGIDWTYVEECARGPLGYQLMMNAEAETRAKTDGPSFVPTIIYNDVFDKEESKDIFDDPVAVLCQKLFVEPTFCRRNQQAVYLPVV